MCLANFVDLGKKVQQRLLCWLFNIVAIETFWNTKSWQIYQTLNFPTLDMCIKFDEFLCIPSFQHQISIERRKSKFHFATMAKLFVKTHKLHNIASSWLFFDQTLGVSGQPAWRCTSKYKTCHFLLQVRGIMSFVYGHLQQVLTIFTCHTNKFWRHNGTFKYHSILSQLPSQT